MLIINHKIVHAIQVNVSYFPSIFLNKINENMKY